MYVIEVTSAAAAAITVAGRSISSGDTETFILPADRCSWQLSAATGGGYSISNVYYYPGNSVGSDLSVTNATNTYRFGYIGKTGRFVEITA